VLHIAKKTTESQRMAYNAKVAAGGMTRRQEINRLEYARAVLNDSKVTWKQAQQRLEPSQRTVIQQMATMKQEDKIKWASFHKNDYKSGTKKWSELAKNNPANEKTIKQQQKLMELKMVFGKSVLSEKQKYEIKQLLEYLDVEDFESYWGY